MAKNTHHSFLTAMLGLAFCLSSGCNVDQNPHTILVISDLPALTKPENDLKILRHPPVKPRALTLAVVGELRGELEPCGCPTLPFGGFERRATLLKQLKEKGPGPLFHLDAGDTLIKGFSTKREDHVLRRAKEILGLSAMVGVDVWVPGTSDLVAFSVAEIKTVLGPKRISATWVDGSGSLILAPTIVLEKQGIRLGVIGLSAPPPSDSGLGSRPALEAALAEIVGLPTDLDMVVALGNIDAETAKAVALGVPGLTAVITTRGEAYATPGFSGEAVPVIESPDRGRYLQVVSVRMGARAAAPLLLYPDPPTWRAALAAVRRGETDKLDDVGRGRNLALVSTIPLSADLDRGSRVTDRLDAYRQQRLKRASAKAAELSPHTQHYASSGACVNCHSDEFARWTLTKHAQAWFALVKADEVANPECVSCHTTAFGKPGGLGELTASNIRKFKGVQCEMCHGPLGGHPQNPQATATPVTEESCLGCHDPANSPKFDYDSYLPRASCQGGAPNIVPRPISGD
jgi:hypothetical protein